MIASGPASARRPSMRLFRQDVFGEWGPVVGRVAAELARLVRRHAA